MCGRDNPEKSISGAQQYKTAKNAFAKHNIFTTRVTHSGRHAGAIEAEALGIPYDFIKRGGGWKDRLGRLETHYLGKLASQFARGMARFWDKPFNLSRNSASPSLGLQRTIFPWIESYFGVDNSEWKKTCDNEMKEIDENEDEGVSDEDEECADGTEFVEEDGQMVQPKKKPATKKPTVVQRSTDTAKRGFIRLLVRCRRVILQDAAVYLHLKKENCFVNTKKTSNLNENPFISTEFNSFQEDVIKAINTPSIDRLQEYEGLVPNIVDTQKEVSTGLSEMNQR